MTYPSNGFGGGPDPSDPTRPVFPSGPSRPEPPTPDGPYPPQPAFGEQSGRPETPGLYGSAPASSSGYGAAPTGSGGSSGAVPSSGGFGGVPNGPGSYPAPPQPGGLYGQPTGTPAANPPTMAFPTGPSSAPPVASSSVPPFGGPVSGPPAVYPETPTSVPPFGQPMSGPPMSGPPISGVPYGAPAAPGKGRMTLILAAVAGLFFVFSGAMTALYLSTNGDLNKAEQRITEQDERLATNAKDLEKLKLDLQAANDQVKDTEQDLAGTKNDRDEQARQKQVIGTCLRKLTTALNAAGNNDRAAYDQAVKGLDKVCEEAEKYL